MASGWDNRTAPGLPALQQRQAAPLLSSVLPRRLLTATAVLAALTLVHDLDHLRQRRSLPAVLYLVAVMALASLAGTTVVLIRRPRWARAVAAAQGTATVVGVGIVHAMPEWSRFADSYGAAHADVLSWAIILAMMVGGLVLIVLAVRAPAGNLSRPENSVPRS